MGAYSDRMRSGLITPVSIATGMMLFAIGDNFIVLIAESMSVWQYHALRAALVLPGMALVMALLGLAGTIRVKRPAAVAARALFTVLALLLYFAAIPAVGVSLAAAGLFTSPVFVVLISVMFFGENIGWRRVVGLVLGLAGVCLVLEIGTQPIRAMALAPMLGGVLYALNVIWTRQFCQQESAGALAFWNMSMFLVLGTLGMLLTPWIFGLVGHFEGTSFATRPVSWPDWQSTGIVAALGVSGALGMVLLALGYRSAPSSYAALFDFSFLFWVPFFAWLVHGETLTRPVAGGMALIVVAGILALSGNVRQAKAGDAG